MFKIGEFSRIGQVSVRMLRHYDHLGLLTPSQTDRVSGYRYYTVDQLPQLHRIVALNHLGITLDQIAEQLSGNDAQSAERLQDLLRRRRVQLERELAERTFQLQSLTARLAQLEQPPAYEVVLRPLEAVTVAGICSNVADVSRMGEACGILYRSLYDRLRQQRISADGPEITIYHSEEFVEHDLLTEVSLCVADSTPTLDAADGLCIRRLPPAASAATLVFACAYEEIQQAVLTLLGWVAARGLRIAGPLREVHRSGPAHPPEGRAAAPAVIELQLPVHNG